MNLQKIYGSRRLRVFARYFILLLFVYIISRTWIHNYRKPVCYMEPLPRTYFKTNENYRSGIELTFRMSLDKKVLTRFFCMLLRSASVFWNSDYADPVIILDEADRPKQFEKTVNSLGLPFHFRIVYESEPKQKDIFKKYGVFYARNYGYVRQIYSSFLMDTYTNSTSVIAWIDTDAALTMPITDRSVFNNDKLIAIGVNTFYIGHVRNHWAPSTLIAIGLPLVADFMTYFPTYVYPSTIKNCREFIMKRFGMNDFEDAFIKISEKHWISPVNIIMSYAYYFEREKYDWHIDVTTETLEKYNELYIPKEYPLLLKDIQPELHVAMHYRYFYDKSKGDPIEIGICYAQISLGMPNIPTWCKNFYDEPNMLLFVFEYRVNHFDTWCRGCNRDKCLNMIRERYQHYKDTYKIEGKTFDARKIKAIDDIARTNYQIQCPRLRYV